MTTTEKKVPEFIRLFQQLAEEAREINAANGWGLDFNFNDRDCVPSYLALIHSEITEAYAADTSSEQIRELGDVIVRCLDLSELIQPGGWVSCWEEGYRLDLSPLLPLKGMDAELLLLHGATSQALETYRKADADRVQWAVMRDVQYIASYAWRVIRAFSDADPENVVREILAANRRRAYRHGGRRT